MNHLKNLKLFTLILYTIIYSSANLFGQDPVFSQFNHHQLYFNPAFAGNSPYPRMVAGYRNQWPGLGNAFITYYISYDQYVNKISSNIGLAVNRDVMGNGVYSKTSADFIYSYPIELNNDNILSLGIQGSVVQKNINGSNLVFPDQNPFQTGGTTEVVPNKSKIYPDFAAGAAFYINEQYMMGFSVHHLNSPNEMIGSGYTYLSPLRYSFMALADYSLNRSIRDPLKKSFKPGLLIQLQHSFSLVSWGGNFSYGPVSIGAWLRHSFNFSVNTFIAQLGYSSNGMELFYSYDAWTPKNYQEINFFGAHEVTFIYNFKYNDPKKRMRTIKCPKF